MTVTTKQLLPTENIEIANTEISQCSHSFLRRFGLNRVEYLCCGFDALYSSSLSNNGLFDASVFGRRRDMVRSDVG